MTFVFESLQNHCFSSSAFAVFCEDFLKRIYSPLVLFGYSKPSIFYAKEDSVIDSLGAHSDSLQI